MTVTNNAINAPIPFTVDNGGTGVQTLTLHGILLGNGTGAINASTELADGQLLIGSTGGFPVAATITAGTGISVTNASGAITIATTGALPWVDITGTTQAMVSNTNYIADNAALVTLTLPATAAIGDRFYVVGKGAGMWKVAQNAGQTIYFGNAATTAGVSGYIEATLARDCVELVCVTTNTDFNIIDSVGNITIA